MKKFFPITICVSLFAVAFLPGATKAVGSASMSLVQSSKTVALNSEFTVNVVLQAATTADRFNSAEATLSFPTSKLQVVSLSKTGSIFTLWPTEPAFLNTAGTISFAGGRTSGYFGTGQVLAIRFRAVGAGDATVAMTSGSVGASDGGGTNILALFVPGHYAVANAAGYVTLLAGDLIKLPDDGNVLTTVDSAVYYFGEDGLRYVFPNSKTYYAWYSDFNNVKEVNATQLGTVGIGGNVTYRPGVKMIKIESDPRVFAVDRGGVRRHVTSETMAQSLYGANWNRMIDDVADGFFTNYSEGSALDASWTVQAATGGTTSISADKVLVAPVEVVINANGTLTPSSVTVARARTVRFTNNTSDSARVVTDPHPGHTGLPGFDSANIPAGLNYVYRFTQAGSFGFHNEADSTKTGTITVTP